MRVKKTGGKVYGATLTDAEKRAINMEIRRQLAEMDKKTWKKLTRRFSMS